MEEIIRNKEEFDMPAGETNLERLTKALANECQEKNSNLSYDVSYSVGESYAIMF